MSMIVAMRIPNSMKETSLGLQSYCLELEEVKIMYILFFQSMSIIVY